MDGVRRWVQSPSVRMTGLGQSAGTHPSASLLKVMFGAARSFERAGEQHSEATVTSCRWKRELGPPALHPCPRGEAPLESPWSPRETALACGPGHLCDLAGPCCPWAPMFFSVMGDDVPPVEGVHVGISAMESRWKGLSGKVCYWWKSSVLIKSECRWLSSVRMWTLKCDLGRVCMHANSPPSYLTLCDPRDCGSPGSSVHGILQARILAWAALSFSRGSSWPRDWSHVSYASRVGRRALHC